MIVLDSSFLVAHHNQRDVHHGAAAATMEKLVAGEWGPALLPEYVFLEVVTVLLARRGLDVAVRGWIMKMEWHGMERARAIRMMPCG